MRLKAHSTNSEFGVVRFLSQDLAFSPLAHLDARARLSAQEGKKRDLVTKSEQRRIPSLSSVLSVSSFRKFTHVFLSLKVSQITTFPLLLLCYIITHAYEYLVM